MRVESGAWCRRYERSEMKDANGLSGDGGDAWAWACGFAVAEVVDFSAVSAGVVTRLKQNSLFECVKSYVASRTAASGPGL